MNIAHFVQVLRTGSAQEIDAHKLLIADLLEELEERVAIMEEGNGLRTGDRFTEYLPTQTRLE